MQYDVFAAFLHIGDVEAVAGDIDGDKKVEIVFAENVNKNDGYDEIMAGYAMLNHGGVNPTLLQTPQLREMWAMIHIAWGARLIVTSWTISHCSPPCVKQDNPVPIKPGKSHLSILHPW